LVRPQQADVIDHQPDRLRQRRQVLQKPLHARPPVQVRRRRSLPHQPRPPAARPPPPASPIHDRSRTFFPLPAGADTTVTRARAPSRPNSPVRGTTPPAPGETAAMAPDSGPPADPMSP